ncbi:MAG: hypothetical protein ACOC00_00050 [Halothiobacillaceae bacterium]
MTFTAAELRLLAIADEIYEQEGPAPYEIERHERLRRQQREHRRRETFRAQHARRRRPPIGADDVAWALQHGWACLC